MITPRKSRWPYVALGAALLGASACRTAPAESDPTAQPQNRYVMGKALPYLPLGSLSAVKLEGSMVERRRAGWEALARVLKPVSLKRSDLVAHDSPKLPLFATWYDAREFAQLARFFFKALRTRPDPEQCLANEACAEAVVRQAFEANEDAYDRSFWDDSYFEEYLGQLRTDTDIHGMMEVAKPAGTSGRGITLFSPELVGHYLKNYRSVLACDPHALAARTCFGKEPPKGAAALKTTWIRLDAEVGDFATDPEGLRQIFATGDWEPKRTIPAIEVEKRAFVMLSRDLGEARKKYVLVGLHLMAKETPDWLWASLWWSPRPDEDYGEDRPREYDELPGYWSNYKMCSTASFDERDLAPWRPYENAGMRSLAAALETTFELSSGLTWCSNPFIEVTPGHAATNCIGCHQHGGIDMVPDTGRAKVRDGFPGDYLWSFSAEPDDFRQALRIAYEEQ